MARDKPAASRAWRPGHANEDLDILVLGRALRPRVPEVEVEGSLCTRSGNEGIQAAEVVIELHEDRVE